MFMKRRKLLFALFLMGGVAVKAQFLHAVGFGVGLSYGKENWSAEQWATQEKYLLGFNGIIFAEFLEDPNYKWRSEIMYNGLGTNELVEKSNYTNRTNYISFDNYLKYQYELDKIVPYALIGPRLEYVFTRSASIFPDAIRGMQSIHLSAAIGAGIELVWFSRIKPFAEVFYNHDIMNSYYGNVKSISPYLNGSEMREIIGQHDYEFRIGFKYIIKGKVVGCPRVINPAGNPVGAQ